MFFALLFAIFTSPASQANPRLVRVYHENTFPQNAVVVYIEKTIPSRANCFVDFVSNPREADFVVREVPNNPREADVSVYHEKQVPSRAKIRVFEVKNQWRDPSVHKVYGTTDLLLAASVCAL